MGGETLYALQVYKCQWWAFSSQKRRRYWPNFKWINFNKIKSQGVNASKKGYIASLTSKEKNDSRVDFIVAKYLPYSGLQY